MRNLKSTAEFEFSKLRGDDRLLFLLVILCEIRLLGFILTEKGWDNLLIGRRRYRPSRRRRKGRLGLRRRGRLVPEEG